jgi:hypothetical protein
MLAEDQLTRLEDAVISGVRLMHETNLMVLGALGDTLPTPPWVDILPVVPRLLEHSFRLGTRLLDVQRHYTLEYLALLGAPEPRRRGRTA